MTPVAPRIVNEVSYVMKTKYARISETSSTEMYFVVRSITEDHLEFGVMWSYSLRQSQLCSRHQKKCSMNQGCHKRFCRHMFFRIKGF